MLGQLLASPRWISVTAVGRRAAEAPAEYTSQAGFDAAKLKQVRQAWAWLQVAQHRSIGCLASRMFSYAVVSSRSYVSGCSGMGQCLLGCIPCMLCATLPSSAFLCPNPTLIAQVVVDMDMLEEQAGSAFAGADSVFCCLGTTRAVRAGWADRGNRMQRDRGQGVPLHLLRTCLQLAESCLQLVPWSPSIFLFLCDTHVVPVSRCAPPVKTASSSWALHWPASS